MKKYLYISSLIIFIALSTLITYKLSFSLAEKYFFDKIFYKKTAIHGYKLKQKRNNYFIKKRLRDIRMLTQAGNDQNHKILGMKTDKNLYTVAIIGDSYPYGLGVKNEERFPEVLEKKLNRIRPTKVYNFGLSGDDIVDNYAKFLLAENNLDIDLYIFGLIENDLIFNKDSDRYFNYQSIFQQLKKECLQEEFVYDWSNYKQVSPNYVQKNIFHPSFSDQYSNLCILEQIADKLSKQKNILYFAFHWVDFKNFRDYANDSRRKYLSAFKERGGRIITPDKKFRFEKISEKENHPSKNTHKTYADILYREITANPKWKFMMTDDIF